MASRWVISYDIDTTADQGTPATLMSGIAGVRACLSRHGFAPLHALEAYATPDDEGGRDRVHEALHALAALPERKVLRRMHVFKMEGALNDVLPIVDQRPSDGELASTLES